MIRGRDCVLFCDLCVCVCVWMSEKSVFKKKSQKNKLICVSVYVWVCELCF